MPGCERAPRLSSLPRELRNRLDDGIREPIAPIQRERDGVALAGVERCESMQCSRGRRNGWYRDVDEGTQRGFEALRLGARLGDQFALHDWRNLNALVKL